MQLRGIANRATSTVNPNVPASVLVSQGYTTAPTGKRTPSFAAPVAAVVQFQALTKKEVEHLDAINVAGTETAAFVNMQLSSPDRTTQSGGDVVTFGTGAGIPPQLQGTQWWVTAVFEAWVLGGWCKVGLTRQMPS
jgi:hypothetical protein